MELKNENVAPTSWDEWFQAIVTTPGPLPYMKQEMIDLTKAWFERISRSEAADTDQGREI